MHWIETAKFGDIKMDSTEEITNFSIVFIIFFFFSSASFFLNREYYQLNSLYSHTVLLNYHIILEEDK